ncbi:MAG: DUF6602 domain-containing protein [Bryobacteraceae bacterium]
MSRKPDSGKIGLAQVFRRVQAEMVAHLSVNNLYEHGATQGAASEQDWKHLFELYLPTRFRTAPVFVVNGDGRRSQQIDLAIFDTDFSMQLFPRSSALYVPVESVYAVFEVKSLISSETILDAAEKAGSVRELRGKTGRPILAGMLAPTSRWRSDLFSSTLARNLEKLSELQRIDLGCALDRGSFECSGELLVSEKDEALIFFLMRLVERLDTLGPAARVDLMHYARGVRSLQQCRAAKKRKKTRL